MHIDCWKLNSSKRKADRTGSSPPPNPEPEATIPAASPRYLEKYGANDVQQISSTVPVPIPALQISNTSAGI